MQVVTIHAAPCEKRRRRAGSSMEYLLILALVVIPLALLSPMLLRVIATYTGRVALMIRLPF